MSRKSALIGSPKSNMNITGGKSFRLRNSKEGTKGIYEGFK